MYWDVAAHRASPSIVGRATGEIAAVMLLATLAQLSFPSLFQRFLPRAGRQSRSLIVTGYAVSGVVAAGLATLYVMAGWAHRFVGNSTLWQALFVVVAVGYTLFALQDSVLMSLRVSGWVAVENNLFGVAKLALLVPLAVVAAGQGIILSWAIPLVGAIVVVNTYIFGRRLPHVIRSTETPEDVPSLRQSMSLAIPQFVTSILGTLSLSSLSLVVLSTLGSAANAVYFVVAQVAYAPSIFVWSVTRLLVVESAHDPAEQRHHAKQALGATGAIVVVALAVGIPFAHPLMALFGRAYAQQGTALLRMLLLSIPGTAAVAFYAAFAWIDGRIWRLLARQGAVVVVLIAYVLLFLRSQGIDAVGYGYLVATGVEFALCGPSVVRRCSAVLRPRSTP